MTTPSDPGPFRQYWSLAKDVVHLNHGSFGLILNVVRQARRDWIDRLDRHPYAFHLYEAICMNWKRRSARRRNG